MSDQGGSDLDVFEGLAKKPSSPEPARHQKTILGLAAPPPPPSKVGAPPPPPTLSKAPPPPPPTASRSMAPPPPPPAPSAAAAAPLPPPTPAPVTPPIAVAPPAALAPPAAFAPPSASDAVAPPPRSPSKAPPPPPAASLAPPIPGAPKVPAGVAPPPAPTPTSVPLASPKDADWDDEDEKTTVFDRSGDESAKALLHGSPIPAAGIPAKGSAPVPVPVPVPSAPKMSAPLPPPPTPSAPQQRVASVPPPPMAAPVVQPSAPVPVPSAPMARPSAPMPQVSAPAPMVSQPMASAPMASAPMASAPMMSQPYAMPPQQSSKTGLIVGGLLGAAALVGGGIFFLQPKTGNLVITVAAPSGKAVGQVSVKVDEKEVCTKSPCVVEELSKGTHMVSVSAPGYAETATQAHKVVAGEETPVNIQLAPKSAGTGVKVSSKVSGLKLIVDGKDVGPLPQELTTLSPGSHTVEVSGNPYFGTFKKTVDIAADELVPVEADVPFVKGEITIELGDNTDKAKIWLKGDGEDRSLDKIKPFPKLISIPADRSVRLVAEKLGFEKYEEAVSLSADQPTKTYRISLYKKGQSPGSSSGTSAPSGGTTPAPAVASTPTPAPAAVPSGQAKLNINSIPISNVILDGKPLGATPKVGVNVSPGAHTVVFVHPEHGRKVKQVTVAAGQTASAAVRFP